MLNADLLVAGIEKGALGVVCIGLILLIAGILNAQRKKETNLESLLLKTIQNNTKAVQDLEIALSHRPCLHDDRVFDKE